MGAEGEVVVLYLCGYRQGMQMTASHKCEEVVRVHRTAGMLMWWELPK